MTPSWHCDQHGCQTLDLDLAGGGRVWVQARRTYCDRGHWEWGFEGFHLRPHDLPQPSYYFMRKNRAMEEVEAWLSRFSTMLQSQDAPEAGAHPFSHGHGAQPGWEWYIDTQGHACAFIGQPGKPSVRAELSPCSTPHGSHVVFTLPDGVSDLDASDRFPRVYFSFEHAQAEAEELLAWRLLQLPAEIPGPIEDPLRPIGQELARILTPRRPALR